MRTCIVGGTGNISTSIVRQLLARGDEVTCFNRGRSGHPPPGARVIQGDRWQREQFEAAMQRERFDAAIDMLCFSAEDAASSVRAFRGVRHFIQCSTVCTYGTALGALPVTEEHPLRPDTGYGRAKAAADAVFLEAHRREGFPATILKPSTTFGPKMGLIRQLAWEFSWIDRIRRGLPLLVCDDGSALQQFLHVDDAAHAFVEVLGQPRCVGQTYHLVSPEVVTWADYHRRAMNVLGRRVPLIGVALSELIAHKVPGIGLCQTVFAHHGHYSPEKLMREVPAFRPRLSLEEGMRQVIAELDASGRIPAADSTGWEDQIIEACQRQGRARLLDHEPGADSVSNSPHRKRAYSMSQSSKSNPKEAVAQLLARAATDAGLRQSLQKDAKSVLEKEAGLTLPPDITLQVLQETATVRYLVIPPAQAQTMQASAESKQGAADSNMVVGLGWKIIDPG